MKTNKLSRLIVRAKGEVAKPVPISEGSSWNLNADQCRAALRRGGMSRGARAAVQQRLAGLTSRYHL